MQKFLILLGSVIVLVGLLYPALKKLPFGRLPGDIIFSSDKFTLSQLLKNKKRQG